MSLSRVNHEILEFKSAPSATIDPKIKKALIAYYDDIKPESQYIKDISGIMDQATAYLKHYLDEHKNDITVLKLAIVLDIDDASISNYLSIKNDEFKNTEDEIILRYRAANQAAIQPVLHFAQYAVSQGVSVFFITSRKPHSKEPNENLRPYTIKTLEQAGYKDWKALYISEGDDLTLPTVQFKTNKRKLITEEGYNIIVNIGDQPSDLEGGYAEKTFKLPNYLYPTLGLPEEPEVKSVSPLTSLGLFKSNVILSEVMSEMDNKCLPVLA